MNQNKMIVVLLIFFVAIIGLRSFIYTVDEREKAIVVQLGEVVRFDDEPGIHFKLPFVQKVVFFDSRILTLDAEPERYLTQEKKSVVVDSFVK
jgi:membrane protease subunit HflC